MESDAAVTEIKSARSVSEVFKTPDCSAVIEQNDVVRNFPEKVSEISVGFEFESGRGEGQTSEGGRGAVGAV